MPGIGEEPRRQAVAWSWETGSGRKGAQGGEWWHVYLFIFCTVVLYVELYLTQGLGSEVNMSVSSVITISLRSFLLFP